MPTRLRVSDEYDSPWKEALQVFLRAFLEFFFADIAAGIDWDRGYESLDKELRKIARKAKVGKRLADKLFKVWLKDGSERWLLIHIEIQREYDKDFEERIFQYNVAAYQMYNVQVISLAALCDDRPAWRPTTFRYEMWSCKTEVVFRIAKLLDYADKVAELEASSNPFAAVVLADGKTRETKHDPANRMLWKLRLVKGLYAQNWSKERIILLFVLIDEMMGLPEDLEMAFDADLAAFEEENNVKYVTSIERLALKKGREEGREEGLLEGITDLLEAKFGAAGLELVPNVRSLSGLAAMRRFSQFLKNASTLDEARTYFR